jgi:hypothetical protein
MVDAAFRVGISAVGDVNMHCLHVIWQTCIPYRVAIDETASTSHLSEAQFRRKIMKTMLLAAAVTLGIGVGSAYAGDGGNLIPDTEFTEIPGVLAAPSVQNVPSIASTQNRLPTQAYATQSNRGTWLSGPNQNQDSNG